MVLTITITVVIVTVHVITVTIIIIIVNCLGCSFCSKFNFLRGVLLCARAASFGVMLHTFALCW